jgi:hypothetical protein
LHGFSQHRAFVLEARRHKDFCLVDMGLEHFPVPGNLCEQSKADREAEVRQRRRRGIVAADTLPFIAKNREAARMPLFAHSLQRLGIRFQYNFALNLQIVSHALSSCKNFAQS